MSDEGVGAVTALRLKLKWARLDSDAPANRQLHKVEVCTGVCTTWFAYDRTLSATVIETSRDNWQYAVDIALIVTAAAAIFVPFLIYGLVFLRRPSVWLEEDRDRIQSRLEGTIQSRLEGTTPSLPYVRLLVGNKGWRRAAHGTQVLVNGYRRQGQPVRETVPLGSPLLAWPSVVASEGAISIFPGMRRPVDLGSFVQMGEDDEYRLIPLSLEEGGKWWFKLALAFDLQIADEREYLPPGEWIIGLTVGADDGPAKSYNAHLSWKGDERSPRVILDYLLDHLEVIAS